MTRCQGAEVRALVEGGRGVEARAGVGVGVRKGERARRGLGWSKSGVRRSRALHLLCSGVWVFVCEQLRALEGCLYIIAKAFFFTCPFAVQSVSRFHLIRGRVWSFLGCGVRIPCSPRTPLYLAPPLRLVLPDCLPALSAHSGFIGLVQDHNSASFKF